MKSLVKIGIAIFSFFLMRFVIDSSVVLSVGAAVIAFATVNLALPAGKTRGRTKKPEVDQVSASIGIDVSALGIDQNEFDEALRGGSKKLATLAEAVRGIRDQRVRAKGQAISDLVARILATIRQDPKDLKPARRFLDYYLDATVKVVEQYAKLQRRAGESAEVRATLDRVEESLDTIRAAYEKQLEQLLQNDVMDLDAELKVLQQTIKMEGLGE